MAMEEPDDVDETMEYLFEVGALVPSGMDNDEMTYQWADDLVLLAIDPELIDIKRAFMKVVYREIEDSLISMFDKGFVEMDIDDDLQTVWSVTDKGREAFRNESDQ